MCTAKHLWETSEQQICDTFLSKLNQASSILDIGCGEGYAFNYMRDAGFHVIGCDRKDTAVGLRMDVTTGLQFESRSFHGVWFAHVIEHLPNPVNVLLEIGRVLRLGGLLAILVPIESICRPGHIWYFPPGHLVYLLARCGFDCRDVKLMTQGYSIAAIVKNTDRGYTASELFDDNVLLPSGFSEGIYG